MNPDHDTTRIVRSWLEPGVNELSDRVLDDVLARLPATPQRRPVWSAWRRNPMHLAPKLAAIAAVVALTVILGATLLPSIVGPGVGVSPTPSLAPSPSAEVVSQAVPIAGALEPGRYHIDVALRQFEAGSDASIALPARVSFDVPSGWTSLSGWGVTKFLGLASDVSMAPFIVDRVYADPCHTTDAEARGELTDPALARTLDGLAEALSASWLPGAQVDPTAPTASVPVATTFAGWPARSLTVESPGDVTPVTDCDADEYRLWQDAVGSDRYTSVPGGNDQLFIVEVTSETDPTRSGLVVIDAEAFAAASAADVAELQAIIESIEIELVED